MNSAATVVSIQFFPRLFIVVHNVQLSLFGFEHKADVLLRYLSLLMDFLVLSKIRQRIFHNDILYLNMSELFMERGLSIVEIAVRNSVSGYQLILGKRLDEMQLLFKQVTTNAEL